MKKISLALIEELWGTVLSFTTIIFSMLAIMFIFLGLVRRKRNKRGRYQLMELSPFIITFLGIYFRI